MEASEDSSFRMLMHKECYPCGDMTTDKIRSVRVSSGGIDGPGSWHVLILLRVKRFVTIRLGELCTGHAAVTPLVESSVLSVNARTLRTNHHFKG
jgi:hypothetical protein